ncbi:phage major tail tube protein [Vibrio parahaemolyticus]|nr:phage major tail tube protein [Vibrio parahaemolyticus]
MAERVLMQRSIMLSGVPIKRELIEVTPPTIKKKMASVTGGTFGSKSRLVGVEPMSGASIKVNDFTVAMAVVLGLVVGEKASVVILDSYQNDAGVLSVEEQTWYGEITDMTDEGAKSIGTDNAMQSMSINFADLDSAKKIYDGKTMYSINLITDEIDFGQGDILKAHRAAVGRP